VQVLAKAAVDGMAKRGRVMTGVIWFVFSMESTSFGVSGSDGSWCCGRSVAVAVRRP